MAEGIGKFLLLLSVLLRYNWHSALYKFKLYSIMTWEGGQKVETSSYKINKYWGCNVHDDYSKQCCIVYLKVAKKVYHKSSHEQGLVNL